MYPEYSSTFLYIVIYIWGYTVITHATVWDFQALSTGPCRADQACSGSLTR